MYEKPAIHPKQSCILFKAFVKGLHNSQIIAFSKGSVLFSLIVVVPCNII